MRSAVVFSSWDWRVFNVPERIAASLGNCGFQVLYCEMPTSRFRRRDTPIHDVCFGVKAFGPTYLGESFSSVPVLGIWQWRSIGAQIIKHVRKLGMQNPVFLYSHVEGMEPLCLEMKAAGFPLVHICMDYPESYQYKLIDLADRVLVIPKTVFTKLRARYGEKILWIPQSIHIWPEDGENRSEDFLNEVHRVHGPRLGYLGPIYARLNLPLLREVLQAHVGWNFFCFGNSSELPLQNVHSVDWMTPKDIPKFTTALNVGVMPYDCFDEKNLHCVPLKLFDYFNVGLPVVSTPVLSLSEFRDLIYFGDTAAAFSAAIEDALSEPSDSYKRQERMRIAREHSTTRLSERLRELLTFDQR
jgi:hypothetical protein